MKKNNRKILIIDDEAYIRRVIELKLKKKGSHVITAENGEEGLSSFKVHQPDVVVTDIKMPVIGHRTGIFDAMRALPPSTSEEVAKASGLNVRPALQTRLLP